MTKRFDSENMTNKCSITLMYETYPKPLPLGTTQDPGLIVLLKQKLIQEATEALRGAAAVGDAVLITTFRNDLDTLQKTLDLLIPPELEQLYMAEIDYIDVQQKAIEQKLDDVELAIQQAKAEVAREILALLDNIFEQRAFVEYHILFDTFRQSLKQKIAKLTEDKNE